MGELLIVLNEVFDVGVNVMDEVFVMEFVGYIVRLVDGNLVNIKVICLVDLLLVIFYF